ncbi:MAG: STAS domain-containing protein, partial [Alphaproteobacteria bacterium]
MLRGAMVGGAELTARETAAGTTLVASGPWCLETATELDARLRALAPPKRGPVTIDLAGIERLDSAGAWLLHRTRSAIVAAGTAAAFAGVRPEHAGLLERVIDADRPAELARPRAGLVRAVVSHVGEATIAMLTEARDLLAFF